MPTWTDYSDVKRWGSRPQWRVGHALSDRLKANLAESRVDSLHIPSIKLEPILLEREGAKVVLLATAVATDEEFARLIEIMLEWTMIDRGSASQSPSCNCDVQIRRRAKEESPSLPRGHGIDQTSHEGGASLLVASPAGQLLAPGHR